MEIPQNTVKAYKLFRTLKSKPGLFSLFIGKSTPVPVGGYYSFTRPRHQGGEWMIAGAIKVIRILDADEVERIVGGGAN